MEMDATNLTTNIWPAWPADQEPHFIRNPVTELSPPTMCGAGGNGCNAPQLVAAAGATDLICDGAEDEDGVEDEEEDTHGEEQDELEVEVEVELDDDAVTCLYGHSDDIGMGGEPYASLSVPPPNNNAHQCATSVAHPDWHAHNSVLGLQSEEEWATTLLLAELNYEEGWSQDDA